MQPLKTQTCKTENEMHNSVSVKIRGVHERSVICTYYKVFLWSLLTAHFDLPDRERM